jgi:PTS system mannose-specific IID component
MTLSTGVLARCFLRSFALQAAWNRRGMQNLGFAFAIEPALRAIYPDPAPLAQALRRHLGLFNCHPYMAGAILGGAIHHELRVAAGQEPPETVQAFKQTLQGPLAAIADGFFWTALRPLFGALGAVSAMAAGLLGVVLVLVLYNAIHLTLRISLFRAGYLGGDALVERVSRMRLPVWAGWMRAGAVACCGLALGTLILRAWKLGPLAVGVAASAAALGYLALARGARLLPTAYTATLAGIGAALIMWRWHGGL